MSIKPEKWGPLFWGALHVAALGCSNSDNLSNFVDAYKTMIPCASCRKHFEEALLATPVPQVSNPLELFAWTVDIHNIVNARINKPVITYDEAYEIWTSEPNQLCTQKFDFKIIIFIVITVSLILFIVMNKK
jgi:hypothetical protein